MLVDHLPDVKVLASGSSFFKPFNKLGEPLSGRQKVITLFPFAALEMKEIFGPMKTFELLRVARLWHLSESVHLTKYQ
jgi:hypothetical protein